MLTIDKFREAAATHFRRSRVMGWSIIAVSIMVCFAIRIATMFLPDGIIQTFANVGSVGALVLFYCVGVGFAATHNERRSRRDPRLSCPRCERPLQLHRALVIASRNCPHCGQRVLAEPAQY
jgi:hypothetical protein